MSNSQRITVGEVFRLPSENLHRYRDLSLFSPFFLFSLLGMVDIFTPDHLHKLIGLKCLALATIALAMARERGVLVGAILGFGAVRFLVTVLLAPSLGAVGGFLVASTTFILAVCVWSDYKPSYELPDRVRSLDFIVSLSSVGVTLAAAAWMGS
jgi:hypothetical protein